MIIFFFGSGLLTVFGVVLLVGLALGSTFAMWIMEHAALVGAILLALHICGAILYWSVLVNKTKRPILSVFVIAMRYIPPVIFVRQAYQYFLQNLETTSWGSAVLDIVVVLGIYWAVGLLWKNIANENKLGTIAVVLASIAHLVFSILMIWLCNRFM